MRILTSFFCVSYLESCFIICFRIVTFVSAVQFSHENALINKFIETFSIEQIWQMSKGITNDNLYNMTNVIEAFFVDSRIHVE